MLREYTVTIGGVDLTVQLSEEEAARVGAHPVAPPKPPARKAREPRNKARTPRDK